MADRAPEKGDPACEPQSPKTIFIHIPKTGGETFTNEIAVRNFPPETLCFSIKGTREYLDFLKLPSVEKEKYEFIAGHVYFGLHEQFESPCKYLAYIRQPVERIISSYYFAQRTQGHLRHAEARDMPLIEFAANQSDLEMSNYQVRMLGGTPAGPVTEGHLERARQNIEKHFLCVGLTERFDESLALIAKLLDLKETNYLRWNVSWNKKEMPPQELREARELITSRNQLDLQLYDFCLARLEAQLAEHGIDPSCLDASQKQDPLFQRHYTELKAWFDKQKSFLEERFFELEQRQANMERRVEKRQKAVDQSWAELNAEIEEFNSLPFVKSMRFLKRLSRFGRGNPS